MSAPVLSISEQKCAISASKKKKKKALKNVLGIPDNLKVECRFIEVNEVKKLQEILNRLLPSARLPLQQNNKSDKSSTVLDIKDSELRENAKNRRRQLSLGVNALNKSIKKNLISAVLFANDIQPKFLTSHLNLLCDYNKIPFLHMPGLRETTRANLGFPCIAVGFKSDTCDFAEAVEEIKSICKSKKLTFRSENEEIEIDSSESEETEITTNDKVCSQSDETHFTYLYRSSVKERAFIPEKEGNAMIKKETEGDFISVEKDISETYSEKHASPIGISSNIIRKQKVKAKKLQEFFTEPDSDEDFEIPKKKPKKDWIIDKKGTKQNCKYYPAKLLKVPSNPNRNKKK